MIPSQKTKKILFWVGLSLPMVALAAMTWLVHQTGGQFNRSFNWTMQTYKVMNRIEQMEAHIVDAEANQRGYLLSGRTEYLEPYRQAMQAIREDLAELDRLTRQEPGQQASLAALGKMVETELVFDPAQAFADGRTPANTSVVTLTEQGHQKLEHFRAALFQAHMDQEQALARREQAAEADVVSGQIMSLVLIGAVALALVLVVVILLRLERLQAFVTVCAWTGQVKFQGQWLRLDEYLKKQFGISVSHSLSQEAAEKMRLEIEGLNRAENGKEKGVPPRN